MEEYIPKSTVVAEIKKRFDGYSSSILKHYDACTEARASELGKILAILDTLETKEVDISKEIESEYNPIDGLSFEEFARIAKHFYSLGLAHKG